MVEIPKSDKGYVLNKFRQVFSVSILRNGLSLSLILTKYLLFGKHKSVIVNENSYTMFNEICKNPQDIRHQLKFRLNVFTPQTSTVGAEKG